MTPFDHLIQQHFSGQTNEEEAELRERFLPGAE